jgi:phosphoribosylformylglycinamidine synthase
VSPILQLRGSRALSEFRLAKLLASLQKADPGVRAVAVEFRHFVELEREPDAEARKLLERLLDYGERPADARGEAFLVVPRLGTISPWSSKATDIARNCGLAGVRRIERGTLYRVEGARNRAAVGALLHDRMTETVLASPEDAPRLFGHGLQADQIDEPFGIVAEGAQPERECFEALRVDVGGHGAGS